MSMRWFWLSFANPERPPGKQGLGVCLVQAGSVQGAIRRAHQLGCNPGGEVMAMEIPEDVDPPPMEITGKLHTRDEMAKHLEEWIPGAKLADTPEQSDHAADLVSACNDCNDSKGGD